jgi:hypothetical protein
MRDETSNGGDDPLVGTSAVMITPVPVVYLKWTVKADRDANVMACEQFDEPLGQQNAVRLDVQAAIRSHGRPESFDQPTYASWP